jgi:hypothetical protein
MGCCSTLLTKDHHTKYGFDCEWITEVKTTA